MGQTIDVDGAKAIVQTLVDSIVRNPNALTWLTQLKNRHEYTAIHSLNVCIISLAFGRHLRLEEQALLELGVGALLHDLGKMRIPLAILNKPARLTSEEFEEIKRHTYYGAKLLAKSGGHPKNALDIALAHHERIDGSGYPRGLKGPDLSLFPKMVAVADFYDAVTSNRVYHRGVSTGEALDELYASRCSLFDEKLVYEFIQCMGAFPVGTVVELRGGDIGIVTAVHPRQRLKPVVTLVMDADRNPFEPPRVLDLSRFDDFEDDARYTIRRTLESEAYGIDPEEFVSDLVRRQFREDSGQQSDAAKGK